MMPVTALGELLRPAGAELTAAAHLDPSHHAAEGLPEVSWHLSRIVRAVDRYLAVVTPGMWFEQVISPGGGLELQAVADAREGLLLAAGSLEGSSPGGYGADPPGSVPGGILARRLASAGSLLAAGSDLLRSHFSITGDRPDQAHSDWVPLFGSVPFRAALTAEAAEWTRDLWLLASSLAPAAAASPGVPVQLPLSLASTAGWLLTATTRMAAALAAATAGHRDRALLYAVPPNLEPVRHPPADGENVPDLCRGIAVSALRIGTAARRLRRRSEWPLVGTAESWRWKATAAAVTCHLTDVVLHQSAGLAADPAVGARIRAAAQAAHVACDRWREAAALWQRFATEAAGLNAPGVADCGDLVVRMGRLASGNPRWTPARAAQRVHASGDRMPGKERALAIVDATHRAADALALMAAADTAAIAATARADGLYIPIRVSTGGRARSRGWATTTDMAALLEACQAAAAASGQAATALGDAAAAVGAPSRALAIVRSGAIPMPVRPAGQAVPDRPVRGAGPRDLPGAVFRSGHRVRGPAEQALRALGVAESGLIARADAIDRASRVLAASPEAHSPQIRLLRLSAVERAQRQLITEAQAGDRALADHADSRAGNGAARVADRCFPDCASPDPAGLRRPSALKGGPARSGRGPGTRMSQGGVIRNGRQS